MLVNKILFVQLFNFFNDLNERSFHLFDSLFKLLHHVLNIIVICFILNSFHYRVNIQLTSHFHKFLIPKLNHVKDVLLKKVNFLGYQSFKEVFGVLEFFGREPFLKSCKVQLQLKVTLEISYPQFRLKRSVQVSVCLFVFINVLSQFCYDLIHVLRNFLDCLISILRILH